MTIKALLGMDVAQLEAMSDADLLAYLQPYITACEPDKQARTSTVIDVSGIADRAAKKSESVDDYIKRMTAAMQAKLEASC